VLDAVSAPRAAWLLTRLRARRLVNQLASGYRFRKASQARTGTARKASAGRIFAAFVALAMVFNAGNLSRQALDNLQKDLGSIEVPAGVQHGWLGVQIAAVTAEVADRLGVNPPRGVLIVGVIDEGPAQRGGIETGDVVLKANGQDIKEMFDLPRIAGAVTPGRNVVLVIVRNREELRRSLTVGVNPADAKPTVKPIAPRAGNVLAPGVLNGATLEATLLLLATLFMTIAGRELTRAEWDLEWLVTLPLPISTLIGCRLVERTATNASGIILLSPFLAVVAWYCGYRWTAPLLGIALTVALSLLVATLQTLLDTGLRISLPPPKLRNLQALVSLVSVLPLLLAFPMAMPRSGTFMFGWAAALPEWVGLLPAGLAVRAISAADGASALPWLALMLGEIVALVAIGSALLRWQLRNGVVAAGVREAAGRGPAARRAENTSRSFWPALPLLQRRELILLGRDRTFMVQTLVLPVIMVGAQVFLNAGTNLFELTIDQPATLAAIAFALAAYTLMASAFQTLNAEGQALWILYCVPRSLEFVLRQKAKLWATVAAIYPAVIFAIALIAARRISLPFLEEAAIVLLGVPIFAVIATSLGVFACDPLAQEVQRRIRPTYVYIYMLLALLYGYAVFASTIWQRAAMMILTMLVAIALWQKARDQFDYLLDPSASPPARVSVSDGMIAALLFFVLQGVALAILHAADAPLPVAEMVWIAFCVAGALTYGLMRLVYWRAHTAGVPRLLGERMPQALLLGAAGGAVASLVGLLYIKIAGAMGFLAPAAAPDRTTALWLGMLAVAAAPLFEEFIFRGLIFGGLRRSFGIVPATLASAAIFAVIHPPLSVIPVFGLGICAALTYERTKMLAAPMLVHAIYNAVIVGLQWNLMQ
jgi:ABC-2 type transport system permease protein